MNIHGVWSCFNRALRLLSPPCALRCAPKPERGAAPKRTLVIMHETPVTKQHLRADLPFQSEEQFADLTWAVMSQACPAQPKPCRSTETNAPLHREWGGEITMRK